MMLVDDVVFEVVVVITVKLLPIAMEVTIGQIMVSEVFEIVGVVMSAFMVVVGLW